MRATEDSEEPGEKPAVCPERTGITSSTAFGKCCYMHGDADTSQEPTVSSGQFWTRVKSLSNLIDRKIKGEKK